MEKVKTIVVPIDFLENSQKLVDYALYIAGALQANLHLVHVVGIYPNEAMFGVPVFNQEYREAYMKKAHEHMDEMLATVKEKNPEAKGSIIVGDPLDEIVDFADKEKADMIVIATHGAKGIEKILLGSVAMRVVKLARCPVLMMNPHRQ